MVLATHGIFSVYNFWLPNDPRGSWSDFVRRWELFAYGPATTTDERRSLAWDEHDIARRKEAKKALMYKPVALSGIQALAVARGFARAIDEAGYVILACSILPKHVHLVIERHDRPVEQIIGHLKSRATQELRKRKLHPFEKHAREDGSVPSVWAHRAWKVFLDLDDDIERAIRYVEENPLKEEKKMQTWSWVRPW